MRAQQKHNTTQGEKQLSSEQQHEGKMVKPTLATKKRVAARQDFVPNPPNFSLTKVEQQWHMHPSRITLARGQNGETSICDWS